MIQYLRFIIKLVLLSVFTLSLTITLFAQTHTHTLKVNVDEIDAQGAFVASIPVDHKALDYKITSTNWVVEGSSNAWTAPMSTDITHTFSTARKKLYLDVKIPAIQQSGDALRRLIQVDIAITYKDSSSTLLSRPTYPAHSVLSSGNWYKIGVTQRGVYKIDAALLSSLGINIASINPKNMRVYGNGCQVMTEHPDDSEPNDLIENAIYLSTSGTTFSSSDYALFYSDGLVKWTYNPSANLFEHTNNYFTDTAYYFITFDLGPGKRIETLEGVTGPVMETFEDFNDYTVIDQDSVNHSKIGKIWWSHNMYSQIPSSLTQNVQLHLVDPIDTAILDYQIGSTVYAAGSQMKIQLNGTDIISRTFSALGTDNYLNMYSGRMGVTLSGSALNFNLRFTPVSAGTGMLDYFRVNAMSRLNFTGRQRLNFRHVRTASYSSSQVVEFKLINVPSQLKVWKVDNPLHPILISGTLSGTQYTFKDWGGGLHEYIAFDGVNYLQPTAKGKITNQDLHGLGYADLIIITHPQFVSIAEQIAQLHAEYDGISSHIVTVDKIYNEFSSGAQDVAGIRNFIRMFYDRATTADNVPKNVLLLGNASYDYKNRISNNTNFVPVYQSYLSSNKNISYSTDDYYALLDSMETLGSTAKFDIGIGRMPINTIEEGEILIQKLKNYLSPQSFGPWKNNFTFLSDNGDAAGNFVSDNEIISRALKSHSPTYNFTKLYADDYTPTTSAAGNFYPQLTNDLNNSVYLGSFLLNYSGHGGPQKLANENILTKDDINGWRNFNKLPVVITGTCDFSRFDNPDEYYAGVMMYMKADGGAIASITTTQPVISTSSTAFVRSYIEHQFSKDADGQIMTIGEAYVNGKNLSGGATSNNIRYVLLGDPALKLALPTYNVSTDSIMVYNSATTVEATDTISALGKYKLYGSVKDYDDHVITDFNGKLYVTFFDKPTDKNVTIPSYPSYKKYEVQNSIVYKGEANVVNGQFTIEMVIPKDINYDFGKGKISYYAQSDNYDAAGADTNVVFGGFAHYFEEDNTPPVVEVYIDNERFRDGGVTGPDPILYVKLYDDNGINSTGSSIGHDIIGVLDNMTTSPYILNNYYTSVENDYRNGYIIYPMFGLSEGLHEITVRAWDVHNNSGEGTVRFRVVKKDKIEISHVYNYPNPTYESYTNFVIQHNISNEALDLVLDIFDAQGQNVRQIEKNIPPGGNIIEILWDCRDRNNMDLPKGVYMYRVGIKTSTGLVESANNKLIIVR